MMYEKEYGQTQESEWSLTFSAFMGGAVMLGLVINVLAIIGLYAVARYGFTAWP